MTTRAARLAFLLGTLALAAACAGGTGEQQAAGAGGGPRAKGPGGAPWGGREAAAVPVEVATAIRRDLSELIETNGTLEAENEVDVVGRAAGPIVELRAEEGQRVARGDLLARLEQDEILAQLEISRVTQQETELAYERARTLQADDLISEEEYEQARAAYESAKAQVERNRIQLGYTEIRAPFDGLVVARYVDAGQHVAVGTALFRISDFTPLLCPIQVPERELSKLRVGQRAGLTVEAFPGRRFPARVLRISPVVDAATGTIRVTLDVDAQGLLRPGMFARVFLETAVRRDTLVIPKAALSLESVGDTVYVVEGDTASRREVALGFREGDSVEVVSGVAPGELVVVVGQDGLSPGTPVRVLARDGRPVDSAAATAEGGPPPRPEGRPGGFGAPGGGPPDFSNMTPEQLERMKQRMRERGMSEEQIEQRLQERQREAAAGR